LILALIAAILTESNKQSMIYDSEIVTSIYQGLENLLDCNQMLHDYWVSELFSEFGDPIAEAWTANNLKLIEDDVMHQLSI
jgi:hypothetical protein